MRTLVTILLVWTAFAALAGLAVGAALRVLGHAPAPTTARHGARTESSGRPR